MNLRICYLAQLRRAAGRSAETIEVEEGCTVARLTTQLAESRPELRSALLSPTLLIFVGDEQASPERLLRTGDEIILMTPIAGGDRESVSR